MSTRQTQTSLSRSRSRSRSAASLLVVVVFGLLLWAKLLLVTNHPRSAIADPKPADATTTTAAADPAAEPGTDPGAR